MKKNKLINFVGIFLFFSFVVIYLLELTGYYEYQNHKRTVLTEEQIKKFEKDVANGKEIDINEYLIINETKYNNSLSNLTTKLSTGISNIVQSGVESTFKVLSKLVEN